MKRLRREATYEPAPDRFEELRTLERRLERDALAQQQRNEATVVVAIVTVLLTAMTVAIFLGVLP